MYTSPNYHTTNPNMSNNIRHINTLVECQSKVGRKSISKKKETMQKVHGNNGNHLLKDNYFGF